jgi:crotonobetainyl-CoA:carnitine CoA-transferase CaiB-like acyl-CoA transferase
MCSAIGIMTAYYWKQYGGGTGQYLDLSKQEALMTIERQNLLFFYEWGTSPTRCDCNYHTIREAAVRCSDGNYVKIVIHPDRQWQGLCRALGSPEWTRQDIFADHDTRAEYFAEMNAYLAKEGEKYTANELFSLIQAEGTACAPICSAEWVYDSPQMEARKFFTEIPHPLVGERKYPGLPYQLTNTTPANNFGAPLLGQHNEEIYCNRLGYSKQDMVRLKEAGVI